MGSAVPGWSAIPQQEKDEQEAGHRLVYVWSDRLRLAGFAHVRPVPSGGWVPVEYNRGRMGRWHTGHIRLCAQALCLEEMTGYPFGYGEILHQGTRRREQVALTAELRKRTEALVVRAFAVLESGTPPLPIAAAAKCRDCPLVDTCLPREAVLLAAQTVR